MRSTFNRILAAAGSILMCLMAAVMIQWGIASRYSDLAHDRMVTWAKRVKSPPTKKELAKTEALLGRAVALDPENPEHHDRLSQLYLWKIPQLSSQEALSSHPDFKRGVEEARKSISGQPGYPIAWTRLLIWKAGAGQLDHEFQVALERSTTLGRWHYAIHPTVLNALFPVWPSLTEQDKSIVIDTAMRGLRQTPAPTLRILKRFGHLDEVCLKLKAEAELWTKYCHPRPEKSALEKK